MQQPYTTLIVMNFGVLCANSNCICVGEFLKVFQDQLGQENGVLRENLHDIKNVHVAMGVVKPPFCMVITSFHDCQNLLRI